MFMNRVHEQCPKKNFDSGKYRVEPGQKQAECTECTAQGQPARPAPSQPCPARSARARACLPRAPRAPAARPGACAPTAPHACCLAYLLYCNTILMSHNTNWAVALQNFCTKKNLFFIINDFFLFSFISKNWKNL